MSACLSVCLCVALDQARLVCDLQSLRRLQRVVLRCAMQWKQRALSGPHRARPPRAIAVPPKSVTFCLPSPDPECRTHSRTQTQSGIVEQRAGDGILNHL